MLSSDVANSKKQITVFVRIGGKPFIIVVSMGLCVIQPICTASETEIQSTIEYNMIFL